MKFLNRLFLLFILSIIPNLILANETSQLQMNNANIFLSSGWQSYLQAKSIKNNNQNFNLDPSAQYPLVLMENLNSYKAQFPSGSLILNFKLGKNIEEIDIKNLNFSILPSRNNLSMDNLQIKTSLSEIFNINNIKSQCANLSQIVYFGETAEINLKKLIFSCFTSGELKFASANLSSDMQLENFVLISNQNKFTINTYLTNPINGDAEIIGLSQYQSKDQILRIEIQSAWIGFFNIKGMLFEKLSQIQNEKIKVSEPYIFLKM
jgi:hypothetical protein